MAGRLAGRNAIITGASRGLGACIARSLWAEGASLLLVARSEADLGRLSADLQATGEAGQQSHRLAISLADPAAAEAIVAAARRAWERLDMLVNNAAIVGPIGPLWQNDWAEWQQTIQVNLLAPAALCRACLPWMLRQGQGKIVNLSGGGATGPRPHFSAYAAAKVGLVRLSETLAEELRAHNIQVNCVAPGVMNTGMLRQVVEAGAAAAGAAEAAVAARYAAGAPDSLQRAADLCAFLCTDQADGITGKLISAVWDPWERLGERLADLDGGDIYTLRRIVPGDRGQDWG